MFKNEPTREELDLYKQANNSETKSKYYIKKLGEELYNRWKYAEHGSDDWFDRKESDDYFAAEFYEQDFDKLREQIGEIRYNEIFAWKNERRERYLRMLASPSPRVARNAAALITFIDDINDTMGTVGVVARTAHRHMPNQFMRLLLKSVGKYAFTAAQLTSIAMAMMRNPMKAKRIQHVIHGSMHGHPASWKVRAAVGKRFARHGIGYGEVIEALQVSNSMFGYGLGVRLLESQACPGCFMLLIVTGAVISNPLPSFGYLPNPGWMIFLESLWLPLRCVPIWLSRCSEHKAPLPACLM
jgi:hypothetical protein